MIQRVWKKYENRRFRVCDNWAYEVFCASALGRVHDEYQKRSKEATKIQAMARGFACRKEYYRLVQEYRMKVRHVGLWV